MECVQAIFAKQKIDLGRGFVAYFILREMAKRFAAWLKPSPDTSRGSRKVIGSLRLRTDS